MADRLVVEQLHKRFDDIVAVDGVDLRIEPGEILGFLGPNGAGKSTTMRSILGLVAYDSGSITLDGEPIGPTSRRSIGYMPQERGLYMRMKVHEHIAYIGRLAGLDSATANDRANRWVERVGLVERRDDLIQELSTGNQQRVQLAVSLVHEPSLLVLDEPFAGLDPVAVATLSDVMVEQMESGVSVIFSSHQLELVQDLTDRVTIIAAGRTRVTGTVTDLRNSSPDRNLEIVWQGEAPHWQPPDIAPLPDSPAGVSRFVVPSATNSADLIASASQAGSIASIRYEPPSLDQVFLEVVGQ